MYPKLPQNGGQQIGAWCKKKKKKIVTPITSVQISVIKY